MQDTPKINIESLIEKQRTFFASGKTREISFRLEMLKKLKTKIIQYEQKIAATFWTDLHNSYEEAYLTEIGLVLGEIEYHLKNLRK